MNNLKKGKNFAESLWLNEKYNNKIQPKEPIVDFNVPRFINKKSNKKNNKKETYKKLINFNQEKNKLIKHIQSTEYVYKKPRNISEEYKNLYDISNETLIRDYKKISENYINKKNIPDIDKLNPEGSIQNEYEYYQNLIRHLEEDNLAKRHGFIVINGKENKENILNNDQNYFLLRPYGDDPNSDYYNHVVLLEKDIGQNGKPIITIFDTLQKTRDKSKNIVKEIFDIKDEDDNNIKIDDKINQKSYQGCFETVLFTALKLKEQSMKMEKINKKLKQLQSAKKTISTDINNTIETIKDEIQLNNIKGIKVNTNNKQNLIMIGGDEYIINLKNIEKIKTQLKTNIKNNKLKQQKDKLNKTNKEISKIANNITREQKTNKNELNRLIKSKKEQEQNIKKLINEIDNEIIKNINTGQNPEQVGKIKNKAHEIKQLQFKIDETNKLILNIINKYIKDKNELKRLNKIKKEQEQNIEDIKNEAINNNKNLIILKGKIESLETKYNKLKQLEQQIKDNKAQKESLEIKYSKSITTFVNKIKLQQASLGTKNESIHKRAMNNIKKITNPNKAQKSRYRC